MAKRDVVVVGASAGGVEAVTSLVRGLPAEWPGSMFIVLHLPPEARSMLPAILAHVAKLPVQAAEEGAAIAPGHVYVAVPDHHLLVGAGVMRVRRGPRENHLRPAADTLFRSAARAFGPRVVGVVLTGALDDGTAGLFAIRRRGGVTVVQSPEDARFDGMPSRAVEAGAADHVLPLSEIPALLVRLAAEEVGTSSATAEDRDLGVAPGGPESRDGTGRLPEQGQGQAPEDALRAAMAVLEESAGLAERMAGRFEEGDRDDLAARLRESARAARQHAGEIRRILGPARTS